MMLSVPALASRMARYFSGHDYADAFMTENSSFLHTRHGATHKMQIGAADSAGGQTHDGVEIVLYGRLLDIVQSNVSDTMENDGFHSSSPGNSFSGTGSVHDFSVTATHVMRCAAVWRLWRPALRARCELISASGQW